MCQDILWNKFKNLFEFFIGNGTFFGLVIDEGKENGSGGNFQVSNNPCPARLSFTFGSNDQTDFIEAIARAVPCSGLSASLSSNSVKSFLSEGYFFASLLACLSKSGIESIL